MDGWEHPFFCVTYRWAVLRFALARRWVPWHVFCLAAVVFMVMAGGWQWEVAFSDISADGTTGFNARNLVYAFQWWIFAAFGVWFWFRFLRDQRDAELAEISSAADQAPEQVHDMTEKAGLGSTDPSISPLISLDDSTEQRRARAAESMAHDGNQQTERPGPVDERRDITAEGTQK